LFREREMRALCVKNSDATDWMDRVVALVTKAKGYPDPSQEHNIAFIAALRNATPELLSLLEEAVQFAKHIAYYEHGEIKADANAWLARFDDKKKP
jgi:hypothetical protein